MACAQYEERIGNRLLSLRAAQPDTVDQLQALFELVTKRLGALISALLPLAMALLIFDGWMVPLCVLGLVITLDIAANMFIEPYLYGRGVGVSEAAALVMVAFWTWLWGPVGIVLALRSRLASSSSAGTCRN